jgi:hypothetical protein
MAEPPLFAGAANAMVKVWLVAATEDIVGASATVATGVPAVAELATPLRLAFFPRNFTSYGVPLLRPEITKGLDVVPAATHVDPSSMEYS